LGSPCQRGAFPGFGSNPLGPEFLITISPAGTGTVALNPAYSSDPGPYDGGDDTYVGVINNFGAPISAIKLTTVAGAFGFDGDGIVTFGAPSNPMDPTGYGGPNAFSPTSLPLAPQAL
jgi:hypothetical protein